MSTARRYFILFILLVFILSCSTVSSYSKPTPTPLAEGEIDLISYISDKNGSKEIYIESLDQSYSLQVTHNDLDELGLYWAPDAQKLLFTACQGRFCDLYLTDAIGENFQQLTNANEEDSSFSEPAWSPDGKYIAFVKSIETGKQIYVMKANGSRPRLLTQKGSYNVSPAWSPNGDKLAYSSNEFGDYDIVVTDLDGTHKTQVTDNDYDDGYPVWSPDATKITFLASPDREKGNILFLVNADGTNVQDISAGITDIGEDVAWSPTTDAIAFSAFPSRTTHQIYGVMADSWGGTQYSTNSLNNFRPSWAPDGKRLVYYTLSKDYDSSEVYVNAGGTRNSHQITSDGANVTFVAWVPIQSRSPYKFPTSTPVPTVQPTERAKTDVYLVDDFSDSTSGWKTGDSTSGSVRYEISPDGTYNITIQKADWGGTSLIDYRYSNVRIEVDGSFDPERDSNGFGIICRAQDYDNYYLMRISYTNGIGYFKILMQKNNEWVSLMDAGEYGGIVRGQNHITASCIDSQLTMSVNGKEVATVYDDTFTEGKVGVYACVWDEPSASINFYKFEAIPIP